MTVSRRQVLKVAVMAGAAGFLGARLVRTAHASDAYSSVVLAKGPVGYWRLGESAGPTAGDASGAGYDGAYFGNPTFSQSGAITGDQDTAVGFNGPVSKDYVGIPEPTDNSQAFSQPSSQMGLTVEAWMRPDALTFAGQTSDIYIHWLGKCISGQCEWGLRFYSQDSPTNPNRISAYIWNPDGGLGAGAGFTDVLVRGDWIHIVGVYEPGDMFTDPPTGVRIYKNGVLRDGPPRSGTLYRSFGIVPQNGAAPLRLGARSQPTGGPDGPNSYFTGALDEVAIYPRALSDVEVLENYNTAIVQNGLTMLAPGTRQPRTVVRKPPVRKPQPRRRP